jgi:hypothetical protein
MSPTTEYRLSDEALSCIIQSVQAAMLTGIDISDLMRAIRVEALESDPGVLYPTTGYIDTFNETMDQLMERALAAETENQSAGV